MVRVTRKRIWMGKNKELETATVKKKRGIGERCDWWSKMDD